MAIFGIEELDELLEEIKKRVLQANRNNTLDQLLTNMGMSDLLSSYSQFSSKDGKIVVLGATDVSLKYLVMTAAKLGIDKSRFEFCLNYDELQKYNYHKLQYTDKYRLIMVGPMPHSSCGTNDSGSTIAEMEKHPEMYPRIVRMTAGTELKITKSGFKEKLQTLLQEGFI